MVDKISEQASGTVYDQLLKPVDYADLECSKTRHRSVMKPDMGMINCQHELRDQSREGYRGYRDDDSAFWWRIPSILFMLGSLPPLILTSYPRSSMFLDNHWSWRNNSLHSIKLTCLIYSLYFLHEACNKHRDTDLINLIDRLPPDVATPFCDHLHTVISSADERILPTADSSKDPSQNASPFPFLAQQLLQCTCLEHLLAPCRTPSLPNIEPHSSIKDLLAPHCLRDTF